MEFFYSEFRAFFLFFKQKTIMRKESTTAKQLEESRKKVETEEDARVLANWKTLQEKSIQRQKREKLLDVGIMEVFEEYAVPFIDQNLNNPVVLLKRKSIFDEKNLISCMQSKRKEKRPRTTFVSTVKAFFGSSKSEETEEDRLFQRLIEKDGKLRECIREYYHKRGFDVSLTSNDGIKIKWFEIPKEKRCS